MRTGTNGRRLRWAVVLVALGGCAAPAELTPPAFEQTVTSAGAATTAEVGVPSTIGVVESVPVATGDSGPRLSPDGPWRLVPSAPGVTGDGLVYELLPGLWAHLPLHEDIPAGVTWTLNAADVPLVEAYLQARRVFYLATETSPFRLDDPGWLRWYADRGAGFATFLAQRDRTGEVFAHEAGVVLRPVVLGDRRSDTTGIVFDCMLDGGVWRRPDGSLGADSVEGVVPNGVSTTVSMVDGRWTMGHLAAQPEACS